MLRNYRFTILFISWVVFITCLSLFSFSDLDTGSVNIPYADKITHFVFYTVFVVVGCLAFGEWKEGRIPIKKTVLTMVLLASFYGIFIEALQYMFTKDRMAEYGDAFANALGAIFGASLFLWYFSKRVSSKRKN